MIPWSVTCKELQALRALPEQPAKKAIRRRLLQKGLVAHCMRHGSRDDIELTAFGWHVMQQTSSIKLHPETAAWLGYDWSQRWLRTT